MVTLTDYVAEDLKYIHKTLKPKMRTRGVRLDDDSVGGAVRLGYPFCYCETCVMRTVMGMDLAT